MAYDGTKLTRLSDLKALGQRVKNGFATKDEVSTLQTKVEDLVTTGGEPNVLESVKVNGTALTITDKTVDITVPAYTITKDESSTEYAAVYHLTKDGTNEGVSINIPKDMVVSSGSVVVDPDGQTAGTYLKLVLANATNDEIYIPVDSLIEYVTSGSATGDMVVVSVSDDHKVTATITDGTVTKAKLASDVQASLTRADAMSEGATKVEASSTNGYIKIDGTETKVYEHPTTTAVTAAFVKVGKDSLGHVVIGDAVSKSDLTTLIGEASSTASGLMTSTQYNKLAGITEGANKVEASTTNGNIKIDNVETTVYTLPSDVIQGAVATDDETTEMLDEVFGSST